MDANTTKRIAEIRQRAEAVGLSPEPWKAIFGSWTVYSNYNTDDQAIVADVYERVDDGSANTIYIACARSDIPYLLDLIQEQAAEIERLHKELLERDAIWLPEKDAEIERLKDALISAKLQIYGGWSVIAMQTIDTALKATNQCAT